MIPDFIRLQWVPMALALLAAALFGASTPLAKLLVGEVDPIALAAFLYLGSGIAMVTVKLVRRSSGSEAPIERADWKWLLGSVVAGGVAAPIVLLVSLQNTPAATASLLLAFEGVATSVIAVLVFRESVSRRATVAIVLVTLATILLTRDGSGEWGISLGALGVLAACALWGIDNNLTRSLSGKDPLSIVMVKGLGAGTFSLVLALALGRSLPALSTVLSAMLLGSVSYGMSIVLFIRALRGLGAARTSALFGTAPLAGVVLSFVIFSESLALPFFAALGLSVIAAALLVAEKHSHAHIHESVTHDHRHRHDDGHHSHDHPGMTDRGLTHSHAHTHERLEHEHPHLPDLHHRHGH
ncbi:MAG: DMT family transporter [Chloroflexi bacterium]|nr:DMT family transporter [Chloroflexota bacterium]